MTYVTEQNSQELRQHMRSLKKMPGWHEPLSDRLFKEVEAQDAELKRLRQNRGDCQMVMDGQQAEIEMLRAALADARQGLTNITAASTLQDAQAIARVTLGVTDKR